MAETTTLSSIINIQHPTPNPACHSLAVCPLVFKISDKHKHVPPYKREDNFDLVGL
jgi:hypothetical protein